MDDEVKKEIVQTDITYNIKYKDTNYTVITMCNHDIGNLDIVIYDEEGEQINTLDLPPKVNKIIDNL